MLQNYYIEFHCDNKGIVGHVIMAENEDQAYKIAENLEEIINKRFPNERCLTMSVNRI